MNIFSLISTLSLRKSINTNVKKRVFKKPVEKEYKDVEIVGALVTRSPLKIG